MPKDFLYRVIRGNQFEHTHNHVQGKAVPVRDDVVYVKMNKGYQPTKLRLLCAGCGSPRSQCRCAPALPETTALVVARQAERRGETPRTPEAPPPRPAAVPPGRLGTFTSASHAALACRHCGYVSCQCPVAQPGSTLDQVLAMQQAQGKR
jgi:hypothetical protein